MIAFPFSLSLRANSFFCFLHKHCRLFTDLTFDTFDTKTTFWLFFSFFNSMTSPSYYLKYRT
jgi:hypothetical protein